MGYMIWYYIRWNFGIEDMILYPILEKNHIISISFSFEILSMSWVNVCDPGEFIYSSKPKKVWHCCLVCLSKIKYLSCYRGAMNSIKLETFNYKVQFRVENSIESKKYSYFISSKSWKSKNISIKIYVGACLVLLGWFDC